MKKCSMCGKELDESNFYKWKYGKDGLRSQCKECCKHYNKIYYDGHVDKLKLYQKKYVSEHSEKVSSFQHMYWEKNKSLLQKYDKQYRYSKRKNLNKLKTPCVKCGESKPYLIDFHHINPEEKSFTISDNYQKSTFLLEEEVKKCVCLCSNCHREFHYLYGVKPKSPVESLKEYLSDNS